LIPFRRGRFTVRHGWDHARRRAKKGSIVAPISDRVGRFGTALQKI